MSSVEEQTDQEAAVTDELRAGLLAAFEAELGDAVVGSHLRPNDELWVRVRADAWRAAALFARDKLDLRYFDFLSALDWLPSPWGRYEDAAIDHPVGPSAGLEPTGQGYAGGETRFQMLARVASVRKPHALMLKADVPEDTLAIDSWTPVYAGADWHERETWEMFGITVLGHPDLRHIYLPTEFEGHPLRKDFPLLARVVKPWPGIVDVEPMPGEEDTGEAAEGADPAAVPDAEDAPKAKDIAPPEPPADAPVTAGTDEAPAVDAPVPSHGEVASAQQLAEGEKAVDATEGGDAS